MQKYTQLASFLLEPRSLLEQHSDLWTYPQLILTVTRQSDPVKRMIQIVRWFIAGWHIRPKNVKKPYDPIKGEVFRAQWEVEHGLKCQYLAEQIHGEQNLFAVHFDGLPYFSADGSISMEKVWGFNSISFVPKGTLSLRIKTFDEVYEFNLPARCFTGVLFGKLSLEFIGKCTIRCASSNLEASLDFQAKSWFNSANKLEGVVQRIDSGEKLYSIQGHWDSILNITDLKSNFSTVFFEAGNIPLIPKEVKSAADQENFESRKLWQSVTVSLKKLDFATASEQIHELIKSSEKNPFGGKISETNELIPRYFSKNADIYQYLN